MSGIWGFLGFRFDNDKVPVVKLKAPEAPGRDYLNPNSRTLKP